jgi:hypothetical protein
MGTVEFGDAVKALTITLGVGHLAFVPSFILLPPVNSPGRDSVISALVHVWPWLFAVSGVWLLVTGVRWYHVAWAHAFGAGVFTALGVAAAGATFLNDPPGNPVFSISCALLAAVHVTMATRTPKGGRR